MPYLITDKVREHFDESLEVFKRKGQVIWNAYNENALILSKLITIDYNSMSKIIINLDKVP